MKYYERNLVKLWLYGDALLLKTTGIHVGNTT